MTPTEILDDLLRRAGVASSGAEVQIVGADPVFPTRFRIADLGSAAISASALQAARIYAHRTGVDQKLTVSADAAAAAMRSFRYLQQFPPDTSSERVPNSFYETRDDRWLFLHRAFPHHLERQLRVLGLGPAADEDAIARAIRTWDAADLEERIMEAGACAAMVRTTEEWEQHPQGRAVASQPLFTITKIGDSDPIPAGAGDRPLGGLRVLDLTRVLAGPTTARTLAEHGAHVLRIATPLVPDTGPMPKDTGHGKRSTVLDLRTAAGRDVLQALVQGADVFSQGYRPGAIDRIGFSPAELAERRPGIISVAISAFGAAGPWSDRRGFDSVVEAADGIAEREGRTGERPKLVPASPLDYTSGYLAAFLVQVALARRAVEGGSYHIELSLAQTGRYLSELGLVDAQEAAVQPAELAADRLDELLIERGTPHGRLRYLRPVAELSKTPARWEHPSVPGDHDPATW